MQPHKIPSSIAYFIASKNGREKKDDHYFRHPKDLYTPVYGSMIVIVRKASFMPTHNAM